VRRSARLPLEELNPYLLEVPQGPGRLDLCAVIGNDHPVEMEVGFGKGLFLVSAGQARPETNFLGVEIERKYQLLAATRLARRGLRNVRLACADARLFLRDRLPAGVLEAVHVYFPDPWWKTRHRKRRVFTEEFTAQCARVLRPGGRLLLASDVAEYFAIITGQVTRQGAFESLPPPEVKPPEHDLDYLTNFERKYRKEGRPIYRAAYVRREGPDLERIAGPAPFAGSGPEG
jgi:tRNA (guanine-N7-)-methyltransferase